jgi:hypothetical protein
LVSIERPLTTQGDVTQLRAKELELELAKVQMQEKEELVACLKVQLEASKEAEVLLHQQITQQHEKVEEVKATIAKTTEVRLWCHPASCASKQRRILPLHVSASPCWLLVPIILLSAQVVPDR